MVFLSLCLCVSVGKGERVHRWGRVGKRKGQGQAKGNGERAVRLCLQEIAGFFWIVQVPSFVQQALQFRRYARVMKEGDFLFEDGGQGGGGVAVPLESSGHLPEHITDGFDIVSSAGFFQLVNMQADVVGGADDSTGGSEFGGDVLSVSEVLFAHAEIDQIDFTQVVKHEIVLFDVSMNVSVLVEGLHGVKHVLSHAYPRVSFAVYFQIELEISKGGGQEREDHVIELCVMSEPQ